MRTKLRIDVVSDVICPWCYVGKRRLAAALDEVTDRVDVQVVWQPYLLNPDMAAHGMSRRDYRTQKFGSWDHSLKLDSQLAAIGQDVGIPFAFDKIERTPSTVDAHRLIAFSLAVDRQDVVVEALFERYFVRGDDVGAPDVLVEVAAEAGFDDSAARTFLSSELLDDEVRSRARELSEGGVTSVPFFVLNNQEAIAGAQEPSRLVRAILSCAEGAV